MLSVSSSRMFSLGFIWSPACCPLLHLIAFPSAKKARTFPRLSNLNESIEQSVAESKCSPVPQCCTTSFRFIGKKQSFGFTYQSKLLYSSDKSPPFLSLFLTTFRVLLFWPQWSTMSGGSCGFQDHHTGAVCCPEAVGAPGSEEHLCHWAWGAATNNNLTWTVFNQINSPFVWLNLILNRISVAQWCKKYAVICVVLHCADSR